MNSSKLVGTYILGYDNVRVEVDGDTDGGAAAVWYAPKDGGCEKIVVVCKGRSWKDCVAGVLHESMESLMHRRGIGYVQSHSPRETNDSYLFVMNHQNFDQCCDWAGVFMSKCLPDLFKVWNEINKKSKKVKK